MKSSKWMAIGAAISLAAGASLTANERTPAEREARDAERPGARVEEPAGAELQIRERAESEIRIEEPAGARADMPEAKHFIKGAVSENNLEIVLGHFAAERSQNAQVRQFAQQIARDHAQLNQQLSRLAEQKGAEVKTEEIERLVGLRGTEFDRAFAKLMAEDHRKHVEKLERISQQHPDSEVKQFAREAIQTMRQHQQTAERLQAQIGVVRDPAGAERPDLDREPELDEEEEEEDDTEVDTEDEPSNN
jgi:putative membrane protein